MRNKASDFAEQTVSTWTAFQEKTFSLGDSGQWVFRGQIKDWPLQSSLERCLQNWRIEPELAPGIEQQMIREFRRQYRLGDRQLVTEDTLYCLSLMQHHGAPTRLLDWTYSPFVAAKFAIESGSNDAVVWCINASWCQQQAGNFLGESVLHNRHDDKTRNDLSFLPLFMTEKPKRFVLPENATYLNERLVVQQGVFAIPGDVRANFLENLKAMKDWNSGNNILKLRLRLKPKELVRFVRILERMNINSAVLFPGLDGFAKSLNEKMTRLEDFARRNVGKATLRMGKTKAK